jgi:hypothetical protein
LIDLLPPDAADSQSAGQFIVAKTVPASAVAHVAGTVPDLILKIADVPIAVSTESSRVFLTVTEN